MKEAMVVKQKKEKMVVVMLVVVVGEPASPPVHVFSVVARYDPDVRS